MQIIKKYGSIGENDVSIIIWEDKDKVYKATGPRFFNKECIDIRPWENGYPQKGLVIKKNIAVSFFMAYSEISHPENMIKNVESMITDIESIHNNMFTMYKKYGILSHGKMSLELNLIKWKDNKPLYDLRYWNNDYTKYSPGLKLSAKELGTLFIKMCSIIDDNNIHIPVYEFPDDNFNNSVAETLTKNGLFYILSDPISFQKTAAYMTEGMYVAAEKIKK